MYKFGHIFSFVYLDFSWIMIRERTPRGLDNTIKGNLYSTMESYGVDSARFIHSEQTNC